MATQAYEAGLEIGVRAGVEKLAMSQLEKNAAIGALLGSALGKARRAVGGAVRLGVGAVQTGYDEMLQPKLQNVGRKIAPVAKRVSDTPVGTAAKKTAPVAAGVAAGELHGRSVGKSKAKADAAKKPAEKQAILREMLTKVRGTAAPKPKTSKKPEA